MDDPTRVYRDAIVILWLLHEAGCASEKDIFVSENVQTDAGLDNDDWHSALAFLVSPERGFIHNDTEGLSITQQGMDYLKHQLRRGEDLPLHREVLERAIAIQERTQRILAEARRLHDEGIPGVLAREQAEVNVVLGELRAQLEKLPPPRKPRKRRGKAQAET